MKFVYFTLLLIIISACGKDPKKRENNLLNPIFVEGLPQGYFLQNDNCSSQLNASFLKNPQVYRYDHKVAQKSLLTLTDFNFSLSQSIRNGIYGQLVQRTGFGRNEQTNCQRNSSGKLVCDNKSTILRESIPLYICSPTESYKDNSIQAVALSSITNIEQAHYFYRKVTGQQNPKKSISLEVLPSVSKVATDSNSQVTNQVQVNDNLSTVFRSDGQVFINIYPKSVESLQEGLWSNLNLWESPWVIAHEVGHVIFDELTSYSQFRFQNSLLNDELTVRMHEFFLLSSAQLNDLTSINEAFADMFAYYSVGGKEEYLNEVSCLKKNRDINSSVFFNNMPKIIDQNVLSQYQRNVSGNPRTCEDPSYNDVHIIGAIIAHTLDKLFILAGVSTPEARMQRIISWTQSVKTAMTNKTINLENLVYSGVKQAETANKLTSDQCLLLKNNFSAFYPKWVASRAISCN